MNVNVASVEEEASLHALKPKPASGVALIRMLSPLTYVPAAHAALFVGLGTLTVPSTVDVTVRA